MSPADGKPALAPANPGPGANAGMSSNARMRAGHSPPMHDYQLPPPPAPRPRNQGGRKKMVPIEPDSLYRGSTVSSAHGHSASAAHVSHSGVGAGAKRGTDGGAASVNEPRKRKRVDAQHSASTTALTHSKQSGFAANNIHASHTHSHVGVSGRGSGGVGSAITGAGSMNISNSQNSNSITGVSNGIGGGAGVLAGDGDGASSLIEFSALPTSALYEYIMQYDLVPVIYPTPLSAEDPPPPAALLDPARMASRAPTPSPLLMSHPFMIQLQQQHQHQHQHEQQLHQSNTPANRPRRTREAKEGSRRRSTRLIEEEMRGAGGVGGIVGMEQVPVLADVSSLHGVLATIAARHFRESSATADRTFRRSCEAEALINRHPVAFFSLQSLSTHLLRLILSSFSAAVLPAFLEDPYPHSFFFQLVP
ncbi:hypothetical protein ACEPAF_3179 [Sanghuangporus sanghuang]